MMKFTTLIGTITFLFLVSGSGWAGSLTVPNTFVSGTKAVAADVNANFNAVSTAVNDNDSRITTNTANISANTSAISGKAAATDVSANTTAINTNIAGIATNATAINANTSNINTNTTAIAAKADASTVTVNTTAINTNTASINTNATNITTNTTNITALQQNGNKAGVACAGNDVNDEMVRVGPICVDKYEASVWSNAGGQASGGLQLGTASDDYSGGTVAGIDCNDNGNLCTGASAIYARSEPGVVPSTNITWFQALQACAASGKRLLSNAEWQMAAAGTDKANCNVSSSGVTNTDSNPACISNWGVIDMVGNAAEWVSDWMQGTTKTSVDVLLNPTGNQIIDIPTYDTSGNLGTSYDSDTTSGVQQANGTDFPAAVYRGGGFGGGGVFNFNASFPPSFFGPAIGFRCAR